MGLLAQVWAAELPTLGSGATNSQGAPVSSSASSRALAPVPELCS